MTMIANAADVRAILPATSPRLLGRGVPQPERVATHRLTRQYEYGEVDAGALTVMRPLFCASAACGEQITHGPVVYSFGVHQADGESRIWHGSCVPVRVLLAAKQKPMVVPVEPCTRCELPEAKFRAKYNTALCADCYAAKKRDEEQN